MKAVPRKRPYILHADSGVDIIGDVHACYGEFIELIQKLGYQFNEKENTYRHLKGRKLISLGDITSRGPDSISMLQFFIRHVEAGLAEMVDSNHGWKIARWLDGRRVNLAHGDEKVEAEFRAYSQQYGAAKADSLREASRRLLFSAPSHLLLKRNGKVQAVAVHAGIRDEYIGKDGPAVSNFCRYGDVSGISADGRPIRLDWTRQHRTGELIVWGHDPRPQPERKNNTLNIDQGCVFGGQLTAYRFPEDELVGVPAKQNYSGLADTPLTRYKKEENV
ncbi:hypothetical protein [Brevibacillus massiliensis]|jgi:hypothetical protein|uniref:hypothetical protein n=1 Tax=Brevibacillus massiliensis TaxID=1118054 RepID=UPI0002E6F9C1|nr:hypothetical protein [Brevibacillus massiliensis]